MRVEADSKSPVYEMLGHPDPCPWASFTHLPGTQTNLSAFRGYRFFLRVASADEALTPRSRFASIIALRRDLASLGHALTAQRPVIPLGVNQQPHAFMLSAMPSTEPRRLASDTTARHGLRQSGTLGLAWQ